MIEIKNHGSAASWTVILIVSVPFMATGYFFWEFRARYQAIDPIEINSDIGARNKLKEIQASEDSK